MPGDWIEVADLSEFAETGRKIVTVGGREACIFRLDDGFFAIDAWCSHDKASLALGDLMDHEVMCPLHGARFDLRTGKNLSLPAVKPVTSYEVRIEGQKVLIRSP
jgi:3-phenylpropionate/trans-cinnamate dioxygenase ferredoxin component